MERCKTVFRIAGGLFIVCLIIIGMAGMDLTAIAGRAACFSVAAAVPDGIYGYISEIRPASPPPAVPSSPVVVPTQDDNPAETIPPESLTVSVEETVIGNIIKKTLSPYTANTSWGNVYVNNQCGAEIDIDSDLDHPLPYTVTKGGEPQILLYHTHTTESFMADESQYYTNSDEPRSTDSSKNMVAVGEVIKTVLENAGYSVVHDTTVHDHPGYTGSYTRSAETVNAALAKYPSIKIAIDVHRDSIASGSSDKVAPVVVVDGREAAQVMLVMGSETGSVSGYPNWRQNLQLAVKLQDQFESAYPQFARAVLLRSAKYNQNLTGGSILIEIGSDANTLEQALYSGELVGRSLAALLDSQ